CLPPCPPCLRGECLIRPAPSPPTLVSTLASPSAHPLLPHLPASISKTPSTPACSSPSPGQCASPSPSPPPSPTSSSPTFGPLPSLAGSGFALPLHPLPHALA